MDPARCHPQTRDAVIEEIMAWIGDNNPDASMMIMHGPAGTGKSALAQSIAERCKLQHWLAAGFFFSRTAPGQNNGHSLIPTIVYQLISSHPELRPPIRMCLWKQPTLLKKSISNVVEDLFIAPFFSWTFIVLCWITWVFGWVHPRLIVIDGLDECADNEIQAHILRAVATAAKRLPRPFRILITCRPELHIMQTLKEPSIDYVGLDLGQRNASQDIRFFLSDKFEELKQNHPVANHGGFPASWPGPDIIDRITENASGQFIYPKVIMAYIKCIKHSPVDRLYVILGSSPKPDRDKPFDTLDALYTHVFSSVDDDPLMRQILGLMSIPRTNNDGLGDYTTPAMIAKILSPVTITSVFLILEQLRSVISLAGPGEPIKFWHASISDFLLDEARSKYFFVDIQMTHDVIARGYLRLFRMGSFLRSPFFTPFLEHYRRALLSERLQQDMAAYDLFSAYKAAVTEPITLAKLGDAWESNRVLNLFHTILLHPKGQLGFVDIYIDGLYSNYPLELSIKESLQSLLDSNEEIGSEATLHALYVPLLYYLLNCGDTATVTNLAEKAVIGILRAQSYAPEAKVTKASKDNPPRISSLFKKIFRRKPKPTRFTLACNDCLSILLAHASHYSTELVTLLLGYQRKPAPLSAVHVNPAMVGPYLEQFEDHADAPPELKLFLEEYREWKRRSDGTAEGSKNSATTVYLDIEPQVST